jgi:K(+)-stimulated pyrophosphate-energized sodium pump
MAGELHGETGKILVSLDAVGNTTKAVTKGFAIGSAVIAAVALFASYIETIAGELKLGLVGDAIFNAPETQINVSDVKTFIGLLIGGSIAFMFSALAIRAVGRTAGVVVQEVRSQFADGGIMAGTKQPDYGPVIDICTAASLRELTTRSILGRRNSHWSVDGQLLEQRRWSMGQRQEVHRRRSPRWQGFSRTQGCSYR